MNSDFERFQFLMQRLRDGSEDAATELAKEYGSHLRREIRQRLPGQLRPKVDSVDIEQQVWKSFFAEAKSLPELKNPGQLIRYLRTMARFKVADEGRHLQSLKNNVRREVQLDDTGPLAGPHPASRDPTPSAVAVFNEEWERLLRNRPPHVRRILEMRLSEMTYVEIAEAMGMSDRTVREVFYSLVDQKNRRDQTDRDKSKGDNRDKPSGDRLKQE